MTIRELEELSAGGAPTECTIRHRMCETVYLAACFDGAQHAGLERTRSPQTILPVFLH